MCSACFTSSDGRSFVSAEIVQLGPQGTPKHSRHHTTATALRCLAMAAQLVKVSSLIADKYHLGYHKSSFTQCFSYSSHPLSWQTLWIKSHKEKLVVHVHDKLPAWNTWQLYIFTRLGGGIWIIRSLNHMVFNMHFQLSGIWWRVFYCWLSTNGFGAVNCSPQASWSGELMCI